MPDLSDSQRLQNVCTEHNNRNIITSTSGDGKYEMETLEKGKVCAIDEKKLSINVPVEDTGKKDNITVTYKLEDVPPWYLCFILGLQHYLTMVGGTVTYPYLIAPHTCMGDDDPARGYLITTTFFVSGICTFLQTTLGVRLPIVQGSSIAFFVPILAILNLPKWQCPELRNETNISSYDKDEIWMSRMREVQGAIIGGSLFEVVIGFTGIVGFLLNWITPLAIVPTISLVGLSLFAEAAASAAGNWGISFFTILLLLLFSQCLKNVGVPYPKYIRGKGICVDKFPAFKLFPVLLTIIVSWGLCAVLTATNVFSDLNPARTDKSLTILKNSPWFRVPYPGQWGAPTFSAATIFGVVSGVIASAIESIGDYYACARLCGAPPPPKHAINRGIWIEGLGCVISGLFGTGGGVTSYSENIGAIGITKVASRRVIQFGALLMILFGMLGKFGALFVSIPEPVIGGVFCVMFSMITAVGLSTLHFVDLNSSRNLFVLGFSIFMGLCVPKWMQANPQAVNTGVQSLDQILTILLSTSMLVGGMLGFILDNTIPGTDEERGILKWKKHDSDDPCSDGSTTLETYDIPYLNIIWKKISALRYFPIIPTYDETLITKKFLTLTKWKSRKEHSESVSSVVSRL